MALFLRKIEVHEIYSDKPNSQFFYVFFEVILILVCYGKSLKVNFSLKWKKRIPMKRHENAKTIFHIRQVVPESNLCQKTNSSVLFQYY